MPLIETLDSLLEQRKFEDVIHQYEQLEAELQNDVVVRLKYADALRDSRRTDKAISVYTGLIEEAPELSWSYVGLAKTYQTNTKKPEKGIAIIEDGIAVCGKTTELQLTLAELMLDIEQPDKAMAVFEELYKQNPKDRWICLGKLQAQVKNRKFIEAVTFAETLYEQLGPEPVLINRHAEAIANCQYEHSLRPHFEFILNKALNVKALDGDTALSVTISAAKMLGPADILDTIQKIKEKLPEQYQYAYELQASYLTIGANYAFRLLKPKTNAFELQHALMQTYDIYTSSGNLKTYLQLATLITDPNENFIRCWFNGLIRAGKLSESHQLITKYKAAYPALSALLLTYHYYVEDYEAVFNHAQVALIQQANEPLPTEVLYSTAESTDTADIPESVSAYYAQQLRQKGRLGLNERILAACFDELETFTRSDFGNNILAVLDHCKNTGNNQLTGPAISPNIPQHIIQFWNTKHRPSQISAMCSTWSNAPGFSYECFSTLSAKQFIKEHFDTEYLSAFNHCALPAEQSDFFRLCYLWVKGGIYVSDHYRPGSPHFI